LKAIKGKNLTKIGSSVDEIAAVGRPQGTEDFAAMFEDLPAQTAIEESMVQMHNSQDVGSINAQVSNALVRSSPADDGPRVVLLKFSRPSSAMRQSLLEADELASCRATLESHGLPVELESGAKIFVRPNNYDPALTAIRLYGLTLYKNHVLVDPELEEVVLQLVQQLHGQSFTYPKCRGVVPLGLAEWTATPDGNLNITRTFIQIQIPNSIQADSEFHAPRTV